MILNKIKKCILVFLIVIVFFLIQSCSLFPGNFVMPNLLLILTSLLGFMGGKKYGMYIGFISGLLIDIFFGNILGFNAVIYMYIGYINGFFNKLFFDDQFLLPVGLVLGSDFVYNFIYYIFKFLLRNKLDFSFYLLHVIIPEIVMTAVVTLIFYKLIYIFYDRVLAEEKRSELNFG